MTHRIKLGNDFEKHRLNGTSHYAKNLVLKLLMMISLFGPETGAAPGIAPLTLGVRGTIAVAVIISPASNKMRTRSAGVRFSFGAYS